MRNRVLAAVPAPTARGLSMLRAEARRINRQIPTLAPMSRENFVSHYTGKRRERYQRASDDLGVRPLELPREAAISAFVKSEKFSPEAKINPDPRMIQSRNARYNTEVGVYLKPIEHHLYRLKNDSGRPLLAKGKSMRQKGEIIADMWNSFKKPVAVSFDGSRWDQHISKQVLEIEHSVYVTSIRDPWLKTLLKQQLVNKCRTQGGWKYVTNGRRMSGDMNTALGNCLLMVLMVRAFMREQNIHGEIFDDGDDVLVFFEEKFLDQVLRTCHDTFLGFGQEVKVENVAHRLEDIVFCQSSPVIDNSGKYAMVANWKKIISQSASGTRYWQEEKTRADMGYSVGQCLLALYAGMPIIQTYAQRLCASGGVLNPEIYNTDWVFKLGREGERRELGTLAPEPITTATRESFWKAYGIDPTQQVMLEDMLDDWTLTTGTQDQPPEVLPGWALEYAPGMGPTAWEWYLTSYHSTLLK